MNHIPSNNQIHLLAVFNGGGRPGRFVMDYKDAIAPLGHTPLCEAMSRYGSDKGDGWHTYTPLYHFILQHRRDVTRRVLEIGIGSPRTMSNPGYMTGASIRGWVDYFPGAVICAGDIDKEAVDAVNTAVNGASAYTVDQKSTHSLVWLWKRIIRDHGEQPFDLIVDDGCHAFPENANTLVESWHMLQPKTGLYVVEDIRLDPGIVDRWRSLLTTLKDLRGVLVRLPDGTTTENDNCLLILERVG